MHGAISFDVVDADSPEVLLVFFAADDTVSVDRRDEEIVIRLRPAVVPTN